jgi:hypothetical protein
MVIHLGEELPAYDTKNGKLVCVKNQSVFSINLKALICKEISSKKEIPY